MRALRLAKPDAVTVARAAGAAVLLCAVGLAAALMAAGMPRDVSITAALVIFAVGFWAFGVLPDALTGLIFLVGAVMLTEAPAGTVFSGFATSAFWLVFAGLTLSACVRHTGLAAWFGKTLAWRARGVGSYGTIVTLVVLFSTSLALVLPATFGRVALLVPLVGALAESLGHKPGSGGRTGLLLAAVIGTYVVPTTFLPANLPNLILAGSLESIYGVTPTFGAYLLLHFPVIGMIKGIALIGIITWLFREQPKGASHDHADQERPALSGGARRLAVILSVTLILWATDAWHGGTAAWIGLTAAIICLLPITRVMSFSDVPAATIFPILLHLGAILGIGIIMAQSGAGTVLAAPVIEALPLAEASDALRLAMLALVGVVASLAATMGGAPAITAPLFGEFAAMTGWSVEAVGMSQVIGYATPLLPYQVPPLVVGIAMANVSLRDTTRVLVLLAAVTTPVVVPAAYFWWRFLGWI